MQRSGEFSLIERHFAGHGARGDVQLGVGDDAAVVAVPPGHELVVTTDTLVAGVHFPDDTPPADIGHKALAVNLSDLAAMGAEPAWVTLALTLADADETWLTAFAGGFLHLCGKYNIALIGGDTTHGPLGITVTALGLVPAHSALRRDGARPGDAVFVSGTLGDAAAALHLMQAGQAVPAALLARLNRPEPRVALGLALRGVASAVIDVSDGLAADLGHVITASGVGAVVEAERLPRSGALQDIGGRPVETLMLHGGDDYELCFCVPEAQADQVDDLCRQAGVACTRIGTIEAEPGLRIRRGGTVVPLPASGYDHFGRSHR